MGLPPEVIEEKGSHAAVLVSGQRIGVSNERDVGHMLQPHHACDAAIAPQGEEFHTGPHLRHELVVRHVGVVPAIGGNHAAIGERRVVDQGANYVRVFYRFNYLRPLGNGSPFIL